MHESWLPKLWSTSFPSLLGYSQETILMMSNPILKKIDLSASLLGLKSRPHCTQTSSLLLLSFWFRCSQNLHPQGKWIRGYWKSKLIFTSLSLHLALPLTTCVTSGQLSNLFRPVFSSVKWGDPSFLLRMAVRLS